MAAASGDAGDAGDDEQQPPHAASNRYLVPAAAAYDCLRAVAAREDLMREVDGFLGYDVDVSPSADAAAAGSAGGASPAAASPAAAVVVSVRALWRSREAWQAWLLAREQQRGPARQAWPDLPRRRVGGGAAAALGGDALFFRVSCWLDV